MPKVNAAGKDKGRGKAEKTKPKGHWITVEGTHLFIPNKKDGPTRKQQIHAAIDKLHAKRAAGKGKGKPREHESAGSKLTASEAADRISKGKPLTGLSAKAQRAQQSQVKTTGLEQRYTKPMEGKLAERMGGKAFPDNGPTDIETRYGTNTRGTELKTIVQGKNDRVNMKPDALARKYEWEKTSKSKMDTVILDHRDRFNEGANKALYSGNEIYYKRGLGNLRIGSMYKVKDIAELKQLQATPYHKLPRAAQGIMVGHEEGWL